MDCAYRIPHRNDAPKRSRGVDWSQNLYWELAFKSFNRRARQELIFIILVCFFPPYNFGSKLCLCIVFCVATLLIQSSEISCLSWNLFRENSQAYSANSALPKKWKNVYKKRFIFAGPVKLMICMKHFENETVSSSLFPCLAHWQADELVTLWTHDKAFICGRTIASSQHMQSRYGPSIFGRDSRLLASHPRWTVQIASAFGTPRRAWLRSVTTRIILPSQASFQPKAGLSCPVEGFS